MSLTLFENHLRTSKYFNGAGDFADVVKSKLYDRHTKERGERWHNDFTLFTTPIGQLNPHNGKMKTLVDTNMLRGSELPAPKHFMVNRISFAFGENTDPKARAILMDETVWTFFIGEKWYARDKIGQMQTAAYEELAVFKECGYCHRIHVTDTCPGCGSGRWTVFLSEKTGQPGSEFYMELEEHRGLYLPTHQQFYLRMQTSGMGIDVGPYQFDLKVWLSGDEARGCQ